MENLFWIGFVGAALALAFAWIQRGKVMSYSEGTEKMRKIAASIREGANAYLKHQYTTVAKVFVVVFVILLIIAFASGGQMLSKFTPAVCLCYRRHLVHAGGLHRHEDRHQLQCPDCPGGLREPQQGPAGGIFLRLRHGLHRGGPGHAGYYHLVLPAALCLRRE